MTGSNGHHRNGKGSAESLARTLQNLRRIFHAVHEASHRVNRRYGLTAPQLWALAEIGENGGILVCDLADRMFVDRSVASRLSARLTRERLVTKRRDGEDHRRIHLEITEKGRSILRRAPNPIQSSLLDGLRRLKPGTLRAVARGTSLLVQHMELEGLEAPFFEIR